MFMKEPKLILSNQQNELFETLASNANKKWYFFIKVYEKVDNNTYIEREVNEIPEGIKKYIDNQKNK